MTEINFLQLPALSEIKRFELRKNDMVNTQLLKRFRHQNFFAGNLIVA